MLAHVGMWAAVVAALRLLKYAIGHKDGWWRLILIILVLGGVAVGLLRVLHAGGWQFARTADPASAPVPSVSASAGVGMTAGIKPPAPSGSAAAHQPGLGPRVGKRPRGTGQTGPIPTRWAMSKTVECR